jgi:DNA-binding CsgD family transcriptional regulator
MAQFEVIEPAAWDIVGGVDTTSDPLSIVDESAVALARLLRDLVGCSAFAFSAWDPTTNSHRHRTLASDGYADATLAHVNDAYVQSNLAFDLAHRTDPRSLRWRDYKRDWNFDFSDTQTAQDYLIPSGYKEGSTMCLRLPHGRYTGAFHMSWTRESAATDERRETTERFRPVLAELCDQLRTPRILVEALAPAAFAIVLTAHGAAYALGTRGAGPHLDEDGAIRRLLDRRTAAPLPARFLWADEEGICHRVAITPCRGEAILVTEEAIPWPYRLSLREVEVLHLVTIGVSNPDIGRLLKISPRTVATHIEHLLDKMGRFSRAGLAAEAAANGLGLADAPGTEV